MTRDILAVDVGTSALKLGVFGPDLGKRCETQRDYEPHLYDRGKADIEPEIWWRALCEACAELKQGLGKVGVVSLAVTTPGRSPAAPEIPTMRESAPELAKFDVSSWFGVFLPKSAPAGIVEALNSEVRALLARDDFKKNIDGMGAQADYGTPQQFSDFVAAETVKFAAIIEKEGLQMEAK